MALLLHLIIEVKAHLLVFSFVHKLFVLVISMCLVVLLNALSNIFLLLLKLKLPIASKNLVSHAVHYLLDALLALTYLF